MDSLCGWFSHLFSFRTRILVPCKPRLTGKVERSHHIDEEAFYRMLNRVVIDNVNSLTKN